MKRSMFNKKNKPKRIIIALFATVVAITVSVFFLITYRITPIVQPVALAKAKSIATRAINTAVENELACTDISYDELVTLIYDNNNNVTALKTDTIKINKLKSALSVAILNEINKLESTTVTVYLGDLFNSELFSKKGPKIYIVLTPVGTVETDIENTFVSSGINQTRHQLNIRVTATVGIVMPTYTEYASVSTCINLGESVLLGTVPDNFTNVGNTEQEMAIWDDINDYIR